MVKQVHEVDSDVMEMIIYNNKMLKSIEKNITGDKWLTVAEAAKYIKKSEPSVREVERYHRLFTARKGYPFPYQRPG